MVDERSMFLYNLLYSFFGAVSHPGDIEEVEQGAITIKSTQNNVPVRFTLTTSGDVIISVHDLFGGDSLALMLWRYKTVRKLFEAALESNLKENFELVVRTLRVDERRITFAAPYKRTLAAVRRIYTTAGKFADEVIAKLLEKFANEAAVSAALLSEELE